ncbi:hypothetical protein BH10PLA2_BH10PLA2_37280 [soil metagenome]
MDDLWKWTTAGLGSLIIGAISGWIAASIKTTWTIREELAKSPIRIREEKLKKVYDRFADAIDKIFVLSNETFEKASIFLTSYNLAVKHEDKIKQYDEFVHKFEELRLSIFGKIIFLPKTVHDAINAFMGSCRDMTLRFKMKEFEPGKTTPEKIQEFMDYWKQQRETFDGSVSKNYQVLCSEIQIAIGLEEPGTN